MRRTKLLRRGWKKFFFFDKKFVTFFAFLAKSLTNFGNSVDFIQFMPNYLDFLGKPDFRQDGKSFFNNCAGSK